MFLPEPSLDSPVSLPAPEESAAQRESLQVAESLAKAREAFSEINARSESLDSRGNLEILGFSRQHLQALRDVLTRGARIVECRIAELGGGSDARMVPARCHRFSRAAVTEPLSFFASYRACCRALCSAMKVAMARSDNATVLMVRDIVLQLERELWMIDAPECNRGAEERRAVALFLSC